MMIDKVRLNKYLKVFSIILLIGFLYLIIVLTTDFKIPCLFHVITKLDCPGCGITRMIASLARFKFHDALMYNPFIFFTLPILLFFFIYYSLKYLRKEQISKWFNRLLIIYLVALLIFGVLRNII